MLWIKVRKLFEKGKLFEKKSLFGTTVCYELPWVVAFERHFENTLEDKWKMHDVLFDLFFEYEYHGQELSARDIALLLGCDHQTVNNILMRVKIMFANRCWIEAKKIAKYKNVDILL